MSLDIGEAFGEGLARLGTRPGLVLAAAFVLIGLVSVVLSQTLQVEGLEALLEFYRNASPEQLDMTQTEYQQQLTSLEEQLGTLRETSPLAVEVPLSIAAAGLLVVAILAEAVSIVAVRVFAAENAADAGFDGATDGLILATLNGFVGGVVVWGLILVGSIFFLIPGLFAAVAFYFFRQEVALRDRNFIDAMAGSWRVTKGNRLNVFALGLLVVVVSAIDDLAAAAAGLASPLAAAVLGVLLGGPLAAFGAAVVTQGYRQLTDGAVPTQPGGTDPADPYDAALDADDLAE